MKKKNTILIVEDESPLLRVIKKKFELSGFEVVVARSAKQTLEYLEEIKDIDVIWLDHYLLGKEDGIDLLTSIKGSGAKWKKIPVFVVSNTASLDKVRAYTRLGVESYYVKAENRLEAIVNDIKEYLEKKKK